VAKVSQNHLILHELNVVQSFNEWSPRILLVDLPLSFHSYEANVVRLHATKALWARGGIAPTHSRTRH
jgi:hypothetical protein